MLREPNRSLYKHFNPSYYKVNIDLSVECLLCDPAAPVRFSAGSEIFFYVLGLGVSFVCVLSYVIPGGGPDIMLATIQGDPSHA